MGKRPGLLYEAQQRLDSLMALGQSRAHAKAQAHVLGTYRWPFSDGKIHAYTTRTTYQNIVMRFLCWCRATYGTKRLHEIDQRANALVSAYLQIHVQEGYSPWTLATTRSALRLFFGSPTLASEVALPARHREAIRRSRTPSSHQKRPRHMSAEDWQDLLTFLGATGLRRHEARALRVGQIERLPDGHVVLAHIHGKGGKIRQIPVLPGQETTVLRLVQGRRDEEKVFPRLPKRLDIHAYRRAYAQALYQHLSGLPLPPAAGRLPRGMLDEEAILVVSRALGHNRRDVVLTYYLR